MRFAEAFSLALKNIQSSKMRTLLTMLGIIIGVMAVIVIVGLGNGLSGYIEDSFSSMGTNTLTVNLMGRGNSSTTVSVEQMYEIVESNPQYFDKISPSVSMSSIVKIGGETLSSSVTGVSEEYMDMSNLEVGAGRNITYGDISEYKRVCVVGEYIDETYFGGNSIGETLRIGGNAFTIVGVIAQQADELEEGGSDDMILVPYSTASRLSFTGVISSYEITMLDEELADESKEALEAALYEIYQDDDSYMVVSMSEILDSMTSMINVLVGVLAGIAAISLLVGGIGIMNIMLVSVTERTREIGIRKSLGARESSIMEQFVTEAAVTSALGGVIGIIMGYLLSAAASSVVSSLMEESFTVDPGLAAVMMAFGISAGIGVLFGYLPAKKAARLNPIDALHFD